MNDFLQELDGIVAAFDGSQQSSPPIQQQQIVTNTPIQDPTNPENWTRTVAEAQDYEALNEEIERSRSIAKLVCVVGTGMATTGTNACLNNWLIETTGNPTGSVCFSGITAVAIIAIGLAGSKVDGRRFMSSPWLLCSLASGAGIIAGSVVATKPYFDRRASAVLGEETIRTEIRQIEVKEGITASPGVPVGVLAILLIAVAAVIAMLTQRN